LGEDSKLTDGLTPSLSLGEAQPDWEQTGREKEDFATRKQAELEKNQKPYASQLPRHGHTGIRKK